MSFTKLGQDAALQMLGLEKSAFFLEFPVRQLSRYFYKSLAKNSPIKKELAEKVRKAFPDVEFRPPPDLSDNIGRYSAGFPKRLGPVVYGGDRAYPLAHEYGHTLRGNFERFTGTLARRLQGVPAVVAPVAGGIHGYTSDPSSSGATAGIGAGIMALPGAAILADEIASSVRGRNILKSVGATPAELKEYVKAVAPAAGTYALKPALHAGNYGISYWLGRQLKKTELRTKQQSRLKEEARRSQNIGVPSPPPSTPETPVR